MTTRVRVLIVDDERFFREAAQEALSAAGFECLLAATGAEGLELAEEPSIGVVVLDVRLPGIDGLEVLRRLREARPELRVIMLSAHSDQELVLEALRLGAFDYQAKPLHDEELVLSARRAAESFEISTSAGRLRDRLRVLESRMGTLAQLARRTPPEDLVHALRVGATEAVADVLGASKTSLMMVDGEGRELRVAAATGRKLPPDEMDRVEVGQGVAGAAFARGEPILVTDTALDERFRNRGAGDRYASGSFAIAPLVAGERALGLLCAADPSETGAFGEEDLALLRILAVQAAQLLDVQVPGNGAGAEAPDADGISLDGQTLPLPETSAPENPDAELARAVCEAVTAEVEPQRLFDAALRPVARALDAYSAAIYLRDGAGNALVREGLHDDGDADREWLPPGRGLTGVVFETGRPVATDAPESDPRFALDVDTAESGRPGPFLCLPLVFRGKCLGVFRAFPRESGRATARTGEVLGAALSAAVRNVLLYRSLVDSIEEVARVRRETRG